MSALADKPVLDAEALLAGAETETSLHDYSDDSFRERFALAVDALRKIDMDSAGQRAAAAVCHGLLTSRLKFFNDHRNDSGLVPHPMRTGYGARL